MNKENYILMSVNPPFSQMMAKQYKLIEYRKQIINDIQNGTIIYIYETKKGKGSGKIIGKVSVDCVIPMNIITPTEDLIYEDFFHKFSIHIWNFYLNILNANPPLLMTDEELIKRIENMQYYYNRYPYTYIENKKIKNDLLKGLYFKKIGEGGNYAILIHHFEEISAALSDFVYLKSGKHIVHPPQNMCKVKYLGSDKA